MVTVDVIDLTQPGVTSDSTSRAVRVSNYTFVGLGALDIEACLPLQGV